MEVEDRNTTGLYSDTKRPPYEISRLERETLFQSMRWPESYKDNTTKEKLCLEFVDNFANQYVQLYPGRAPLLLTPQNEMGVRKFISTFLRPSELQFEELYDADKLVLFLANYIRYEELDDKFSLPIVVNSPTTTLKWQVGNCIEMCLTVCSVLLGVGYDAYVVVGYATEDVCTNNQTRKPWPGHLPVEKSADDDDEKQLTLPNKYTIKRRPNLDSKFDKDKEREEKEKIEEPFQAKIEEMDTLGAENYVGEEGAEAPPPMMIHSWILVCPGKREVTAHTFVEVSTGTMVSVSDPSYLGVESVFNHYNCWINMQESVAIKDMSFDFRDLSKWENVFLTDPSMAPDESSTDDRSKQEAMTSDVGDQGDQTLDVPVSWVFPLSIDQREYENRYPGMYKRVDYKDTSVELFATYSEKDLKVMRVKIIDEFNNEHSHTFFKFREDHLRRHSVYPVKKEMNSPKVDHEWYEPGRKKHDQTRVEGLRELVVEPGKSRIMRFYWKAREDGLAKRVELFDSKEMSAPNKIMEYYRGREDDKLIYRSATYDPIEEADVGMTSAIPGHEAHQDADQRVPRKMAEKFERNHAVRSENDVYKRTFILPQKSKGEIWVLYHYGENQITRPFRLYPKTTEKDAQGNEPKAKISVLPFVPKPKESALVEELRVLLLREKECFAAIKKNNAERKEILELRATETNNVKAVFSVYDTLRVTVKESEMEDAEQKEKERQRAEQPRDEVLQWIAQLPRAELHDKRGEYTGVPLTAQEIQDVRERALGELKERLIRRAHIMQNRLEEEREKLAKAQSTFQKSHDVQMNDNAKAHDDFLLLCEQATNRIKIFERRLEKHQTQALQRYADLDQKLRNNKYLQL